jgi:hypothetical protein
MGGSSEDRVMPDGICRLLSKGAVTVTRFSHMIGAESKIAFVGNFPERITNTGTTSLERLR